MTNIFNKVTQSVSEAFKGPRTKDFEFEKMAQEYQVCKERMLSLKNIIDRYPEKLEGYKLTLDQIVTSFATNMAYLYFSFRSFIDPLLKDCD